MIRWVLLAVMVIVAATAWSQRVRLGQVMSQEEMRQMGLDRLSSVQRERLENWLTRYTARFQSSTPQTQPKEPSYFLRGTNLDVAPKVEPEVQFRQPPTEPPVVPPPKPKGYSPYTKMLLIQAIEEEGLTIKLSDGSSWAVNPLHRDRASYWKPDHQINVYRSGLSDYPYRLVNLTYNEWVEAELTHQPTPASEPSSEPTEEAQLSATPLKEITEGGAKVTLEDGTTWEVAPWHKYKAKSWQPKAGVRVMMNDSTVYPSRLLNLGTQEWVEARQAQ